jgi:hypothetical protein
MPTHHNKNRLRTALRFVQEIFFEWWPRPGLFRRYLICFLAVLALWLGGMYGIAQWYIHSEASTPYTWGVSFIPDYAESLGVNPEQTMDALTGIGVKHFRLVSYWSDGEPTKGQYDFTQLDWEFKKAEAAHAKVTLSLGLRQPRWPECHMPNWTAGEDYSMWGPQLKNYVSAVVNRYKNSPALDSYQVENEYFLKGFGICETIPHSMDRARLVAVYNLVKMLDPDHTVIVNRSNNALGWPVGAPTPDTFGISIYKRVWTPVLGRYIEYPFPAWFYGFVAGWQKIMTGRDMIIHELQAESWGPKGQSLTDIDLTEANKSLNAHRLDGRFKYAEGTGMREAYLWGAEYWYYRMQVEHDPSLWNVAKDHFSSVSQS